MAGFLRSLLSVSHTYCSLASDRLVNGHETVRTMKGNLMHEVLFNGVVKATGPEIEVRRTAAEKFRSVADLYESPMAQGVILAAADVLETGPVRRVFNGRARLLIEIREVVPAGAALAAAA